MFCTPIEFEVKLELLSASTLVLMQDVSDDLSSVFYVCSVDNLLIYSTTLSKIECSWFEFHQNHLN